MTASSGHAWTRSYEPQRNLISAVENTYGSTVISRFDYANDEIGRRTAISRSGTAFDAPVQDAYGYNARSEVTSARRALADNPNQGIRGFSYDYAYDPIGNRITSKEYDHEDNARMSSYAANALNQYTQRTVPGYACVRGSATNTATVTVNGNAAWRLDEYFYGGDEADNAASAVMKELDITAVVNPPGTNDADLVQSVTGRVFVAQSPEAFTHDDDGNLLSDGRFTYTWDGENRLVAVETRADLPTSVPRVKVSYAYDHQSRRIGKQSYALDGATWQPAAPQHYTYDGWNMIAETSGTNTTHYIWGLDLSGSRQGAGGVGGLLAIVQNGETYHSAIDGNGNVMEYISTDGTLAAHYEYSPFGETVVQAGPLADTFGFRFSTKYWENKAKLYYYGYRFYVPESGRWLNRDPIGERGGRNLSCFCLNNSLLFIDPRGKAAMNWGDGDPGDDFGPGSPILPPPAPPLPPEDENFDISGIDFSTNSDGIFDFPDDDLVEVIQKLEDLLPECYWKMKDAEVKARAWHAKIQDEYICCNRDGTQFDLHEYPGAVKEYANSVLYGDRHTYGVMHCATGYYAAQNGVDNPCLAVANLFHEAKELAKYGEWLPQSVVSHGKNPLGWYGDTLLDVLFVFAGSTFSSVDACIPSECTKKGGK